MAVAGCESLGLVVQVSKTFKSGDVKEAQKQLESLTGTARRLIEVTKKKVDFLKVRDEELKEKEKVLHRKIGSAEDTLPQQRVSVNRLKAEKARMNADLEEYKQELRRAESGKRDAERSKENSIAGTAAGGVTAGLLGVFFPPSLIVTALAVAAIGGTAIADAQKRIDQQQKVMSEKQKLISSKKDDIQRQDSQIRDIELNISALESLEQERGQLRQTIVFLQQAITYFEELKVATEGGKERTELLHRIAEKLTARETYSITSSKGFQKECHSFMEAWGNVEEKLNAGDPNLAITWQ